MQMQRKDSVEVVVETAEWVIEVVLKRASLPLWLCIGESVPSAHHDCVGWGHWTLDTGQQPTIAPILRLAPNRRPGGPFTGLYAVRVLQTDPCSPPFSCVASCRPVLLAAHAHRWLAAGLPLILRTSRAHHVRCPRLDSERWAVTPVTLAANGQPASLPAGWLLQVGASLAPWNQLEENLDTVPAWSRAWGYDSCRPAICETLIRSRFKPFTGAHFTCQRVGRHALTHERPVVRRMT